MTSSPLSPITSPNRSSSSLLSSSTNVLDPDVLLDTLERQRSVPNADETSTTTTTPPPPPFDSIDFLNQYFETEQSLAIQLPSLQTAVSTRMQVLNDQISNALQQQSDTADTTRRHVQDARASVVELQRRIRQVQDKAHQSERAVLTITTDMKRLDCAKQHLQRTITTLKQLHMLVHAVEQLRLVVAVTTTTTTTISSTATTTAQNTPSSFPDYKTASHLVDAITQLLQHFTNYTYKVPQMRILSERVLYYQESLRTTLVFGFRVVTFGYNKAMRLEGKVISEDEDDTDLPHRQSMSIPIMQGGILFIDSLGMDCRKRFIHDFCQDLLGDYLQEFTPPDQSSKSSSSTTTTTQQHRVSSFKAVVEQQQQQQMEQNQQAGLIHMEKRFTWFLNGPIQTITTKYPNVFPVQWNVQATLSSLFLQLVCVFLFPPSHGFPFLTRFFK
jgi:vacuolar protein sorting-associated protein 53